MFNFLRKDKEAIFWEWFVKNKSKVEKFMNSDFSDFSIYKELSKRMKDYNSILFPEPAILGLKKNTYEKKVFER